MKSNFYKIVLAVLTIVLCSCQKSPEPISYGNDLCENCKMAITDSRYGAELITNKGKIYKYDSIECLADHSMKQNQELIHSMWVSNLSEPHNFIDIKEAFFLKSDKLKSPMGLNLSAVDEKNALDKLKAGYGGEELSWNQVLIYVKKEWE